MPQRLIATEKAPTLVECTIIKLYVGNVQHRFFIHQDDFRGPVLSDERSGMSLGLLSPIKLRAFSSYARMTNRAAAKQLVEGLVAKHGVAKVRETMAAAPTLNG